MQLLLVPSNFICNPLFVASYITSQWHVLLSRGMNTIFHSCKGWFSSVFEEVLTLLDGRPDPDETFPFQKITSDNLNTKNNSMYSIELNENKI